MELAQLRSFVALTEQLHFGKTARRLHLSQPALSKRIRLLEEEIGAPLFARDRHGTRLTEVGQALAQDARIAVQKADLVLQRGQRAARGEVGRLHIGFGLSALELVPRAVSRFRRSFPEVQIELREMSSAAQVEALLSSDLHVGHVRLPVDRRLAQMPVLEDRLVLAVPATRRRHRKKRSLAKLHDTHFVMLARDRAPSLHDHVMRLCARHGFAPRVAQEASELPTILALVAAGLGLAIVPRSARRTRIAGVLFEPIADAEARWQVGAAWRGEDNVLVKTFVTMLAHARRRETPW